MRYLTVLFPSHIDFQTVVSALIIGLISQFVLLATAGAQGPDPVSPEITESGVIFDLVEFVRIPPSGSPIGPARINNIVHAGDGSGRLFVSDMNGAVYLVNDGELELEPFLDLRRILGARLITREFELGLTSLAFHPDHGKPGRPGFGKLYTVTSETIDLESPDFDPPTGNTQILAVLREWNVDPDNPDQVEFSTGRIVMTIGFHHNDHQVGQIAFNPNSESRDFDYGLLYMAVGDGGNTFMRTGRIDEDLQGQNTSTPFGSILRINPLRNGQDPYAAPLGNPFNTDDAPALLEIWAYGFRNPQRFSWDTGGKGAMFIGDIGQGLIEEINVGRIGGNYGWSKREGRFVVNHANDMDLRPLSPNSEADGFVYPVFQYDHDEGRAVSGGYVYRGRHLPALQGFYVFGDIVNGRVFYFNAENVSGDVATLVYEARLWLNGTETTFINRFSDWGRADMRFGQDEEGEIYVLTKRDGRVRKLVGVRSEEFLGPGAAGQISIWMYVLIAAAVTSLVALIFARRKRGRVKGD